MTKRKMIAAAAVLAPAVLAGCAPSLHEMPIGNALPVEDWAGVNNVFRDDKIYFAGQPTLEALREAPKRGIKVVVNLRAPQEMADPTERDEQTLVRKLGLEYVSIPVTGETLNSTRADELKAVLDRTTEPVLIHCASSNRVGAVWALYLHRHRGFSLDEAIKRGEAAGMTKPPLIQLVRRVAQSHGPSS